MNSLTDNTDLSAAKAAVQRSLDTLQVNQATLYTHDGHKIHPPEQHTSELARLVQPVEAAVDRAVALADKAVADVERTRLNQFADPMSSLDLANLELAATHRVFVAEDCATLPVPDLVGRLQWAASHPGRYYGVLYARYGAQRFQSMLDAKPQPAGIPELRAALESLGAIGQSRGLSSEAVKRQEAAAALKRWATWQLGLARDPEKAARDKAKSAELTRSLF